jgi:uncharacterized membrane protein
MAEGHPDLSRLTGPDRRGSPLGGLSAALAVALAAGLLLLRPPGPIQGDLSALGITDQLHRAEVSRVVEGTCSYGEEYRCRRVTFTLLEGPAPGSATVQEFEELPSTPDLAEGDTVVLSSLPDAPPLLQYQFSDRERRPARMAVTAAFALAVVALGRLRGLASLVGLGASVVVIVGFMVPAALAGRSPVLVAAVGAGAIAYLALYLAHGITVRTHVALLGTLATPATTILLSWLGVTIARLSGLAGEEALLLTVVGDLDLRGLLPAGMVLGALGAVDDVTVTQTSVVWELRGANPGLDRRRLYAAGVRVGRDHIASAVNTLLLAYAGASLPLLVLFSLSRLPLGLIATSEVVAVEIVRTFAGSIGLVAAIPLTTWPAAAVGAGRPPDEG